MVSKGGFPRFCRDGVSQDYKEAIKWYRKGAEQGDAYSECNIGIFYVHGYGVSRNYQEAMKWYQKAANQGNAVAEYNIGNLYEKEMASPRIFRKP